jgi:glycosyltransferase involved in cell wall biosynthesis
VADPWPWLLAADAFVLSSRSEGFPNALCEAMVAGVPVVSADCPSGPRDIITDGEDGLLVPAGDPSALADGMLALASDAALRRRLGTRARAIGDRYGLTPVLAQWDTVIAEARRSAGPGRRSA